MQLDQTTAIEGRYLLRERIATHGPVELYAAHDEHLDRAVTVQLLSESAGADAARAFLRHQQLASSIHNCPLFAVYDAGRWRDRPYSVMEREKGVPPAALHRPGYPPDLARVLRVARQIAESLACCREAGLTDWTFSFEAVRVDREGNGCLAIFEGLKGRHSSSHPGDDARAVHALMLLMLSGREDADEATLRAALVPEALLAFLKRLNPVSNARMQTASDIAGEIAAFERASVQPTQAYTPSLSNGGSAPGSDTLLVAAGPPLSRSEAPTVVAHVAQAMPVSPTAPAAAPLDERPTPYTPPEGVEGGENEGRRVLPVVLLLGGILMVVLLLFAIGPLIVQPSTTAPSASAGADQAPFLQSDQRAAVPGLLGMSLDAARDLAGDSRLNLALGEPVHDANIAVDTVAHQEPPPGTEVQAGSLVTVSLSLGPEPQPTEPQPPQVEPPPEQPPAVEPQPPDEEKNKKGGKKGRDKDDDD